MIGIARAMIDTVGMTNVIPVMMDARATSAAIQESIDEEFGGCCFTGRLIAAHSLIDE